MDRQKQYSLQQKKKKTFMQPVPPTCFPRRVKRFQSLSMTPFEQDTQLNNESQIFTPVSSIRSNLCSPNKICVQQIGPSRTNQVTNQCSFNGRKKLIDSGNLFLKNTHKAQLGSTTKQVNAGQKISGFLSQHKQRKMTSPQIFDCSPVNVKNYFSDDKPWHNQPLVFRNTEKSKTQLLKLKSECGQGSKKDRETHVPSFLQNKKRPPRYTQIPSFSENSLRDVCESTSSSKYQHRNQERKTSCITWLNLCSLKNINSQNIEEIFRPPTYQKVPYSKATASTICSNLPIEDPRKTLRDFEETDEIKQVRNYIEESGNSLSLRNDFQNLFRKEESTARHPENIENQIAELFSDEESESDQFDESLQNELEQLF